MKNRLARFGQTISVGIVVAATGVGAGDIVMAALAGSRYGVVLLWAVLAGAVLKYALNEGLAKWDLATGTTLLRGWVERLPRAVAIYFGLYLVFWGFLVAGTLISFTGLVAHTVFPLPVSDRAGVAVWGAAQSLLAVGLVYLGGFAIVERVMKLLVGLMFVVVLIGAIAVAPDWTQVLSALFLPRLPAGADAILFVFALIGGIGGSLTILCYAYWLREKRAMGAVTLSEIRLDLGVAYGLTALFGIAVIIIAAGVNPADVKGYGLVISIATELGRILGPFGQWSFLLGFWGAVFSSLLGVWNGVPYLFADFVRQFRAGGTTGPTDAPIDTRSPAYRLFLWYLAVLPLVLVWFGRPNWIGVAYAVSGAFFMPFLAALLLYMNNRVGWVGRYRNHWLTNALLLLSLLLFAILFGAQVIGVE